jgi:putative salt-induced outer membrane protein YdiY
VSAAPNPERKQGDFMQLRATLAVITLVASPLAIGQDSKDWEGEGELGVLVTSGNTEETNINGRLALIHEVTEWRNSGEFRSAYSETDDVTTAEKYRATLQSDFKFEGNQYLFVRGDYEDDRFSGYDFQSSLTTGYGNRLWNRGERSFLDLSAGVGYRFNKLEVPDADGNRDQEEAIVRLAGQFDYALSENALFRQKLSTEIGLDENNTITESETSVQATVVGNVSMKAAYRVKHVSDEPEGSDDTDTEISLSLLYGF